MKFTGWDIVLTNLQPGLHTLEGRVFSDAEEYGWVVHLAIEEKTLMEWASRGGGMKSGSPRLRSDCFPTANWSSRLHGSCIVYA